ncbi:MAG: T9SS type A sorting domain-containing protein, partial [Candidatus Eisenbacteria bacterium]|nr:T9SS type A sorting domain-containing protein [Candidatus Eisenbacteria bacterium]
VAASNWLYIFGPTGALEGVTNFVDLASESPSLGDTNDDGDLEIAVPTTNGKVHLFGPTGTSESGWPQSTGNGQPVNQVALANFVSGWELDLVYTSVDGEVHAKQGTGSNVLSYPHPVSGTGSLTASPLVNLVYNGGNISFLFARGSELSSRDNLGAYTTEGYPREVYGNIELTPALGDIDLDGSLELVVLTDSAIEVFDINKAPQTNPERRWNMHGANAARTSCSSCSYTTVTGVDDQVLAPAQLMFAGASPNPASGPTTFNYALPTAAMIELAIFDVQGRRIWNVMKPEHPEGNHTLRWNGKDQWGSDVNPGVYFARMRATGTDFSKVETRKVVVER